MANRLERELRALAHAGQVLMLTQVDARTLRGEHEGVSVAVRFVESASAEDGNTYWTSIEALLPIPLRMGLQGGRQSSFGRIMRDVLGTERLRLGHPAFDEAFVVRARDVARASALFQQAPVCDALMAVLPSRNNGILLSDASVSIGINGWCTDVEQLRAMLTDTHRVAKALIAGHANVPPSAEERAASEALHTVAARLALTFDPRLLTATGSCRKLIASVKAIYHPSGQWTTDFEARFPASLALGLRLVLEDRLLSRIGSFFGAQDVEVGHGVFDATFQVKGKPEDLVVALLTGDVAERILALHAVAKELHIGDDGVVAKAQGVMGDAAALESSLSVVLDVATSMATRAWGGATPPYR